MTPGLSAITSFPARIASIAICARRLGIAAVTTMSTSSAYGSFARASGYCDVSQGPIPSSVGTSATTRAPAPTSRWVNSTTCAWSVPTIERVVTNVESCRLRYVRRMRLAQVRTLRTAQQFLDHLAALGIELPFDADVRADGPLAAPLDVFGRTAANRFAILPMEGWDGAEDGSPTDLVRRRWRRFGESGAGLIWGGEAVAVRADGRANPRQLVISPAVAALRAELLGSHPDPRQCVVGLQLTHSGRFAGAPLVAYEHPYLDARVGPVHVLSDGELDELVDDFVGAAVVAHDAGYDFVDIKHCHGYLLHELLSARARPGRYGGDLAGRTRFLAEVVRGVKRDAPGLGIGVRVSVFDLAPFRDGAPETTEYSYAFGGDGTGTGIDLDEPDAFVTLCELLGVAALCVTAGSPYYCPHAQRPAYFPPSDGYAPPRDPLIDVARLLHATAALRRRHPGVVFVGSGYSYLQEWLPHVAQAAIATHAVDSVGIGRLASVVSAAAVGCLAWSTAAAAAAVPHVQRLHDGAAQRARVGLLSARRVLQGAPGAASAREGEARVRRKIVGMAAVLLPFTAAGDIDWDSFARLVARTREAGLVPAVNMDTGFGALLSDVERMKVLSIANDGEFVAAAYVDDEPGAGLDLDAYRRAMATITNLGGTPIVFPSWGLAYVPEGEVAAVFAALARDCDRFLAFELGEMFAAQGRIFTLETYQELLGIRQCVGAKHSSLRRQLEWDRLRLRDRARPDFMVLTGNDRAIDMVTYGSDYLLGLATFAPDWFAARDRAWERRDDTGFWERNDMLQYLGQLAFRDPVPAYRHSAAQFLALRGWVPSDRTHPSSPERPASDIPILEELLRRGDAC